MMLNKFLPAGNVPNDPLEASRRRAAIAIFSITGSVLFILSGYTLLGMKPDTSIVYLGNIISLAMASIGLICAWVAYRYDLRSSMLIYISTLLFTSLGIPIFANGVGLQSSITIIVIVTALTINTLQRHLYQRIIIITIFIQGCVVVADLYLPNFGIPEIKSQWTNLFLAISILLGGFYVFRQFPKFSFSEKLSTLFSIITLTSISMLAIGLNTLSTRNFSEEAGLTILQLTDRLAEAIGEKFATEVRTLQVAGTQFEELSAEANATYEGKSDQLIVEELLAVDAVWRASNDGVQIIQTTLNNEIADELHEFQDVHPEHLEVFLTDRQGALLASTNRTSDYYQADEGWWQAAYNNGNGAVYISQPEFDESINATAILMAVPLYNDGELVGILRSTLDTTVITGIFEEEKITEIGHADLRISRIQLLGAEGTGEVLTEEEVIALIGIPNGSFKEILFEDALNFVSEQKIASPIGDLAAQAVADLGWSVIVHQESEKALLPVKEQTRTTITLAALVLILSIAFGFYATQLLATPIVNLTTITNRLAQGNLFVRAEINTADEIGTLSGAINQMASQLDNTFKSLEQRVAERTADLNAARIQSEERAKELETITDVSRIIAGEQQLGILLPLITRLISERFDHYHAGIFLEDENRRFMVLQAANSDGGRRMMNRGHRLEFGQGLVGTVAQTGQARIALDVGSDAVFFNNPDLPATRSEIALPLTVRGETIGVLDVQSVHPGAFEQNDLQVLGVLADQIAISIENARLFERNQQSILELQTLYNQFLKKEWSALRGRNTSVGYQQSVAGGTPLLTPIQSDEIRAVLTTGETQILTSSDAPAVTVPIKLRDETIGILNVKAPEDGKAWTQDELNLIQSVADRLAVALESARLLEGTNRRAERERLVAEITSKIRSVNDPQTMIQTAMNELRNALGASRVQVIPDPAGKGDS